MKCLSNDLLLDIFRLKRIKFFLKIKAETASHQQTTLMNIDLE